ncbi:hypothetical protein [Burkholderia pseudomallei]|uniref:hypothetical protein n=1 Tax=Burkholderia pseudomallei TaxID=28450 RepID=UPI0027E1D1B7|nr:hypothetical protein [Burkholderia pseudomallei]
MSHIHCRPRKNCQTVALVRDPYSKARGRSGTDYRGSIRKDADPDDVKAYIRIAKKYSHLGIDEVFTVDDLVYIREWLMEHGDPKGKQRRKARDARVERDVLERLRTNAEVEGNPLVQVVKLLPAAGEMLLKLSEECRARGQEPYKHLRDLYMDVLDADKIFLQLADKAGVRKKKRGKSDEAST